MVQWLGLRALTAEGPGLIPGRGTKIPQGVWPDKKFKKNLKNNKRKEGPQHYISFRPYKTWIYP